MYYYIFGTFRVNAIMSLYVYERIQLVIQLNVSWYAAPPLSTDSLVKAQASIQRQLKDIYSNIEIELGNMFQK